MTYTKRTQAQVDALRQRILDEIAARPMGMKERLCGSMCGI